MDRSKIDLYLLGEMPEQERDQFEDTFVDDEALFYEIVERENDIIDRYASGEMSGEELERFERSLASNPERRQKVANSRMLRDFIAEQRAGAKTITIAERSSFSSRLAGFFSFQSPALRFGSAALILLFALWSTYLLLENRRLRSLEQDLASARVRQSELESQIENEQEAVGDLAAELNAERDRVKQLEDAVAGIKRGDEKTPPAGGVTQPTIATLVLSTAVTRAGTPIVPRLELPPTATRVSIVTDLPMDAPERVAVRLNGASVATGLRVRTRAAERSVSFTVPASRLKDGANTVEVLDSAGQKIVDRNFSTIRQ